MQQTTNLQYRYEYCSRYCVIVQLLICRKLVCSHQSVVWYGDFEFSIVRQAGDSCSINGTVLIQRGKSCGRNMLVRDRCSPPVKMCVIQNSGSNLPYAAEPLRCLCQEQYICCALLIIASLLKVCSEGMRCLFDEILLYHNVNAFLNESRSLKYMLAASLRVGSEICYKYICRLQDNYTAGVEIETTVVLVSPSP